MNNFEFGKIDIYEDYKDFNLCFDASDGSFMHEGGAGDGNGNIEFPLTFPETTAKYLKVVAGCLEALPEWHSGKGRPGFVFVGEIIVK